MTQDVQRSDLDRLLERLPLRIGVYVPEDILEDLFPPGAVNGSLDPEAQKAAADYARRFDCEFRYDAQRHEGTFWKFVPAI